MISNKKKRKEVASKSKVLLLFALFLTSILFLFSIPHVESLDYGCCFHPDNFCQNVASAEECCGESTCADSVYDPSRPCSETKCEWQGCCLQTCSMSQYKDCNYDFRVITDLAPTYNCESALECSLGCCVYLTSSNELGNCEIKTQQQCQPEIFYPNIQFHSGFSQEECNMICSLNETSSGSIDGFVTDSITLGPVEDAQIIASGITVFSDSEGYYLINNIPSGQINIEVFASGYEYISKSVLIESGKKTNQNFALEESILEFASLKGRIQNPNEEGIFGFIYYENDFTFTDSNGYYTLSNVPSGRIRFDVIANYYLPSFASVDIIPNTINTYDFVLQPLSEEELCGNNIINFGEECEKDDDSSCQGMCSDCQCPDSCADAGGDCYTWQYQCEGNSGQPLIIQGLDICSAYKYGDSSYGCCDRSVEEIPLCTDAIYQNLPISSTDMKDSSGTMCKCGQQYFDIANPDQGAGYCCNGVYRTNSQTCELAGAVSGFISSLSFSNALISEEENVVENADLTFTKIGTNDKFSYLSQETGFYFADLPKGNYSVLISKEGYEDLSGVFSLSSADYLNINFTMLKSEFLCSSQNITPISLYLNHFQGIKQLELSWASPCSEYIDHFEIYRNNQLIKTTKDNLVSSYIDSSIEWGQGYTYHIVAVSIGGARAESNHVYADSGSLLCENNFEDESWCFDSTKRVVCSEKNQPILWDGIIRGSANGDCSIAIGNGSICQMEDGKTWCNVQEDCSQTGLSNHNIFGLFYNLIYPSKSCLYENIQSSSPQKRYCYYDSFEETSSFTSVDKCLGCSAEMTCFDYQTENACMQDNCLLGEKIDQECEWQTSYENFMLLGKGYCIPSDYSGTDHCSECSENSELFMNIGCTHEVCEGLGSCYSSYNNSHCLECNTDTTCESYLTEEDCIGLDDTPFSISGKCSSSSSIQFSDDNCNLGRCAWENNYCIKDGNRDGNDDCSGDLICLKDNSAPVTSIINTPSYINYEGSAIMFESTDSSGIETSSYCIGSGCCPLDVIQNNTIFLSGLNRKLENKEGLIDINYYSVDVNKNIEELKTSSIYFDTKKPSISLFYYIQNSSNSTTISDLFINISVSEPSFCSESLTPGKDSLLHETFISSSIVLHYPSLEDGRYNMDLKCKDLYQNTGSKKQNISVDRYQKISDESPNLVTLPESEVNISLTTLRDQLYCYYQSDTDYTQKPFNKDQSGLGKVFGSDYVYTAELGLLKTETYNYNLKCYNHPNGKLIDSSRISFTIDSLPPSTNLSILNPDGRYRSIEEKQYPLLNFKLTCEDAFQELPGGIGCGNTYFCITQEEACTPDSIFLEPQTFNSQSSKYTICYYSEDKLNNKEDVKCESFTIDHSRPAIKITSPDMLLTTHENIEVSGFWNETSDVSIFVKARSANNELSDSIPADIEDFGDTGEFSAEISLFSGYNQITATIYDESGNYYSDSIVIYYDDLGPSLKSLEIKDTNAKNDPDTDFILEYSSDLYLTAKVNDYTYSDIYDEKTSDIASVSIDLECIQSSGCQYKKIHQVLDFINETSSYYFEYSVNESGPLPSGDYLLKIIMEDEFSNIAEEQFTISIRDTLAYSFEIFNHNNQRMDNLAFKGESGYPIIFNFAISKTSQINSAQLSISSQNSGVYNKNIDLVKIDSNFSYRFSDYLPSGIYSASYLFSDASGKSYHDSKTFEVADTLPAAFNITIYKEGKIIDSAGFGIYDVKIISFEPISEINYLEYSFNKGKDNVKDISGQDYLWEGKLYIPANETYINIKNANAVFKISAKDINSKTGGNILYGKNFKINTVGPSAPTIFEPSDNINKTIYTRDNSIYFSGLISDFEDSDSVIIKINKMSFDKTAPGWENKGLLNLRSGNSAITEWKTSLYGPIQLIAQNQIRINDYMSLLQPGRFIDFASIKTSNKAFREIKQINLYSDPDGVDKYYDIFFEPELANNISNYQGKQTSQNILIYESKYPDGWFDGNAELSNGNNYVAVQVMDSEGNYGEFSNIYRIIYDSSSPTFNYISPTPDSYTNDERPVIKSSIYDVHSPIKKDSIYIEIMEEGYNISCGENHCIYEDDKQHCSSLNCYSSDDGHEINISYLTPVSYISGWKEVTFYAEDLAGNYAEEKFGFWVDGLSPSTPQLEILPGNKIQDNSPYTLYSNSQKPEIEMKFLKYETIELSDYYILDSNQNKVNSAIKFDSVSDNIFEGKINNAIPEGEYSIFISARKFYPNGTWSNIAFWKIPLIIDTIPPVFEASLPSQTGKTDAIVHLSYKEENPYYFSFSGGASGEINYKKLSNPMDYLLEMNEEQGTKQISVVFYDKAGNYVSKNLVTYYDSLGPEISDNYIYDGQWVKSPQTIAISANDPNGVSEVKYCTVSGCDPILYGTSLEYPYILQFEEEQVTNIAYAALDRLNNPSEINTFSVLFDKTAPELQIYSIPIADRNNITLFGRIKDQNIDKIDISGDLNSVSYTPETGNEYFSVPISLNKGEGRKIINAKAYDLAGNSVSSSLSINLDYDSSPFSVSYIEDAIIVDDYFISSDDTITVHGYYTLGENSIIYPKINPSNLAEKNNGEFTIELASPDGYLSLDNQEKTNIIYLVAKENSGQKYEISLKVINDDAGPEITIEDPKGLSVKSSLPLIKVSTNEPASCTISYPINYQNTKTNMETTDKINHNVQVNSPLSLSNKMEIICEDLSGKQTSKNFTITIDNTKPIIYYADLYGSEIVSRIGSTSSFLMFRSEKTSITSFANEKVRCKYGNVLNYEEMNKFPDFDEYKFSAQQISPSLSLENGDHIIYLLCEDAAGNIAQPFKILVSVNTKLPIQILELSPEGYTNKRNPEINLQTYRNATCYAEVIDEYDSRVYDIDSEKYTKGKAELSASNKNSRITHTAKISGPSPDSIQLTELKDDTSYGFAVNCISQTDGIEDSETKYIYFKTDFTSPDISITYPTNGITTENTLLNITGITEEESNYTVYVNDELQTYPTITHSGEINDFVILKGGQNIIRIEVYDKAGNFAKRTILVKYSNKGLQVTPLTPVNQDILSPVSNIRASIISKLSDFDAEMMIYEFQGQQSKISSPGSLSVIQKLINLNMENFPLQEGKYRYYIIPKDSSGNGQGINVLFEVGQNSPDIRLKYPYSELPYTGFITNNENILFEGTISSESLLNAEIYINGILSNSFNENSFHTESKLVQGTNNFVIKAITLENSISLIHGDITLDSNGPSAAITVK